MHNGCTQSVGYRRYQGFTTSLIEHKESLQIEVQSFANGFELFQELEESSTEPDVLFVGDDLPRLPTCQTVSDRAASFGDAGASYPCHLRRI